LRNSPPDELFHCGQVYCQVAEFKTSAESCR
jgi:hypothetical protein